MESFDQKSELWRTFESTGKISKSYELNPVHNDFKNADTLYSEPRASNRSMYHPYLKLFLALPLRFLSLRGLATRNNKENTSERLKIALNRMF